MSHEAITHYATEHMAERVHFSRVATVGTIHDTSCTRGTWDARQSHVLHGAMVEGMADLEVFYLLVSSRFRISLTGLPVYPYS